MDDPGTGYGVTPQMVRDSAYGLKIPEGATVDAQIQTLINKAATRLDERVPSLRRRVIAETLALAVVQGVIEDMVLRVIRNPKAYRSLGLDDFQTTIDNSTSTGLLYVSADELELLRPKVRSKFRTLRIGVPRWRQPGVDC